MRRDPKASVWIPRTLEVLGSYSPYPSRMNERISLVADGAVAKPASLRTSLYRYFFYGWLFRDADRGTGLEQAIALRHNRAQAKWLPIYLLRWAVGAVVLLTLELVLERALGSPMLSAALAVAVVFAVMYLLVTTICWAFLHERRQ